MFNFNFFFIRNVPGVFGNQQSNYLVVIKQMLQQSLNVPDSNVSLNIPIILVAYEFHLFIFFRSKYKLLKQFVLSYYTMKKL